MTKEIATEANVQPLVKQVRHRAINTERPNVEDKDTNTRPRGVHVSITYGGDEQVDLVDSYLNAIKDMQESGGQGDDAFAGMDNLTRARLRRKLKERWSTTEAPGFESRSSATPFDAYSIPSTSTTASSTPTNSAQLFRRFSDYPSGNY